MMRKYILVVLVVLAFPHYVWADAFVRTQADTQSWQGLGGVFTDLQEAIDFVAEQGGGQVRVARGVYAPSEGQAFSLRNGVIVTGGFGGDETGDIPRYRMEAEPSNQTILVPSGSNVFRHTEEAGIDETAVLENVTITGARNKHSAVHNAGADPSFVNVVFIDNEAEEGAAMFNYFSVPSVVESKFLANSSGAGGGAMHNVFSAPQIRDSLFQGNSSRGEGGAVHNEASAPVFVNVEFFDNKSKGNGGAVFSRGDSNPLFNSVSLMRNESERYGGAIFSEGTGDGASLSLYSVMLGDNRAIFGGGLYVRGISANVVNASFYANTAQHGGAAYADNAEANFINAYFFRNTADNNGGAMHGFLSAIKTFNSHFLENKALGNGGGVFNSGGSVLTLNSLFVMNNSEGSGGAIFGESASGADSRLEMLNSTVTSNTAHGGAGGVSSADYYKAIVNTIISGNKGDDFYGDKSGVFKASIVGQAFFDKDGNIDDSVDFDAKKHLDSGFVPLYNPAQGDNPAIGTGDTEVFESFFGALTHGMGDIRAYDLNGAQRVSGGRIDIGALESNSQPLVISMPAPIVHAHTGTGQSAGGSKVDRSVYISAWLDVSKIDNFPFVRRNGYLPFEIYVGDKYGQELYSGLKIEYNSGEYTFWSSLAGATDSSRVALMLDIERGGLRVVDVSFGGAHISAVPVDIGEISLEFAGDVRGGGTASSISLSTADLEPLSLSNSFEIEGNRLIVDISNANLRYGQKYRLEVSRMTDSFGNIMDDFAVDFVTRPSPDIYEPTITGMISSVMRLPKEGGLADITVAGSNLDSFEEILVTHNDIGGVAEVLAEGYSAIARGIFIPPNTEEHALRYTFRVKGDGVDKGKEVSIVVEGQAKGGLEPALKPIFSQTNQNSTAVVSVMPEDLELVANGIPMRISIQSREREDVSINTIGGEAVVVVGYAQLEAIKEANPHFILGVDTPLGKIHIPADIGAIVSDIGDIMRDSGMTQDEIYLRLGLRDSDKRPEGFIVQGRPVDVFVEVVGRGGKVLRSVGDMPRELVVLLPLPLGGVLSGYASVYIERDEEHAFVPSTLADDANERFIQVKTSSTGSLFLGESEVLEDDVNDWYLGDGRDMRQAVALGIISGAGDEGLALQRIVTRGEFVRMVANALGARGIGEIPFVDITQDDWQAEGIAQLHEKGLLDVFGQSTLYPEQQLTREEAATVLSAILMRQPNAPLDFAHMRTSLPWEGFSDAADFVKKAQEDAQLMVRLGIMQNSHAEAFAPTANMTRQDAVSSILKVMRAIGNII